MPWTRWNSEIAGALEVSDDGQNFRTIRPLTLRWPVSSVNFQKVTARYYRILLKPDLEDDWFFEQFAKGIPLGEVELHADLRIEDIPGKAAYIAAGRVMPASRSCRRRWPSVGIRSWISLARWTRTGSSLGMSRMGNGRCCALDIRQPGK